MKRTGIAIILIFPFLGTILAAGSACGQTGGAVIPPASPGEAVVQTATQPPSASGAVQPDAPADDYQLQEEDVIRIFVLGEPELTAEQVVDPKGSINVPLLGSMRVAGLTKVQLTDELVRGFSKYLVEPKVQVLLAQFRRPKVYVVGHVNRPGSFDFRPGDRVMEAIAQGGSFTQAAYLAGATLTHQGSKDSIPLDMHKLFFEGDMSQNMPLRDGDTIYVPEDVKNRFFVLGEVNRPGRYELKEGVCVMDAISEAGGVSERGSARSTYIVRGDAKNSQRIKVDVAKFLKSADVSQNIALKPGDLVYVPESKKPDWAKLGNMLNLIVNSSYLARMWGF